MLRNKFLYGSFIFLSFFLGYGVNEFFSRYRHTKDNINTKPSYTLFHPNYDVTYQTLLQEGFQPLKVDVIQLEKQINQDINIQYFMQDYKEEYFVGAEIWIIEFDTFDLNAVKAYIDTYKAVIITDLHEEEKKPYRFFVQSYETDLLFKCQFSINEDRQPILTVEHQYPYYARGGVLKNHPMFQE